MDASLPPDTDPVSRNRLAPVRREDLDDAGRRVYDGVNADPRSLVGVTTGPPGILLHDAAFYALWRPVNQYLRYHAGLDARLIEVAILAAARAMDACFEWHAHEAHAREQGVSQATIETIRGGGPLDALPEDEAALVRLARQSIVEHRVTPEAFADALRLFGEKRLVDYVCLIGTYASVAILLETFDQQLPTGAVSTLPRS